MCELCSSDDNTVDIRHEFDAVLCDVCCAELQSNRNESLDQEHTENYLMYAGLI